MLKVMTIVGTRPEIIKLSSVIKQLDLNFKHVLVHTGQNYDYELNEIFFNDLGIRRPDYFLGINGGTAANVIGNIIISSDEIMEEVLPDAILIYGDTNSCLSIVAAKKRKIPIFHLEAGNRSFDQNIPEELNRKVVDHLSDINLTLTEHARRYLLSEGLNPETVFKVGSLMPEVLQDHSEKIINSNILSNLGLVKNGYLLASLHREENVDFKDRLHSMMKALEDTASHFKIPVYLSTHPRTRNRLDRFNINVNESKVKFIKPLGFYDYNNLQINAFCVLSDSGTLTEEASILNFPGVMLRAAHERPEGVDAGISVMAQPNACSIIEAVNIIRRYLISNVTNPIIDFREEKVSHKVIKIIYSYTDYINKYVWKK